MSKKWKNDSKVWKILKMNCWRNVSSWWTHREKFQAQPLKGAVTRPLESSKSKNKLLPLNVSEAKNGQTQHYDCLVVSQPLCCSWHKILHIEPLRCDWTHFNLFSWMENIYLELWVRPLQAYTIVVSVFLFFWDQLASQGKWCWMFPFSI